MKNWAELNFKWISRASANLGVTEEEFKANPELRDAIAHMNKIKPIDEGPKEEIIEEEEKKDGNGVMD